MIEQRIWKWAALGCAMTALAFAWHTMTPSAGANAVVQTGRATNVATIDVGRVLELLDERADRQAEYDSEIQARREMITEMEGRLKTLTEELDVMPAEGERRREKFEQAVRLNMQLEFEGNFASRIVAEKRKDLLLAMFNKISAATDAYAAAEGWDIVLVSDHKVEIPSNLGPAETSNAILSRRVLSAADAVDITDEVAQRMNNEYSR